MVGRQPSSTILSKAKFAPKEDYGDCLMACCRSYSSQLFEPERNDDATKAA